MLTTPEAVINRASVMTFPEYEDVLPMGDCAGFYTFRRYPAGTQLAKIVTKDGRPAVRCYLAFIVAAPATGSNVSRLELKAWFFPRWRAERLLAGPAAAAEGPDGPSPQSSVLFARVRRPIDLDPEDMPGFIYDSQEDAFMDADGNAVSPHQILEQLYEKHCRTLGLIFRIRWNIGSAARWLIREGTWKAQDIAMWVLLTFYEVEVIDDEKKLKRFSFFYKYKPSDFRRVAEKDGERSHFFGFQSSRKNLFTNLTVVVLGCLGLYLWGPRTGLPRVVYSNTALTTAALVFGFLLADTASPWLLIRVICVASRFRDRVLFFIRKVNV